MAHVIQQRAGKLTERIEIMRKVETVSETGSVSFEWQPVSEGWGYGLIPAEIVEQELAKDVAETGQLDADRLVFRIRFFDGVRSTDHVRHDDVDYALTGVKFLGRKRVLELHCKRLPVSKAAPEEWQELELPEDAQP